MDVNAAHGQTNSLPSIPSPSVLTHRSTLYHHLIRSTAASLLKAIEGAEDEVANSATSSPRKTLPHVLKLFANFNNDEE